MSGQSVVENFKYTQYILKDGRFELWYVVSRKEKDMRQVSLQNANTGNYFAWDSGNEAITQQNEPYWWHATKSKTPDDEVVYTLQVLVDGDYANLALSYNPEPELGLQITSGDATDEAKWRVIIT